MTKIRSLLGPAKMLLSCILLWLLTFAKSVLKNGQNHLKTQKNVSVDQWSLNGQLPHGNVKYLNVCNEEDVNVSMHPHFMDNLCP